MATFSFLMCHLLAGFDKPTLSNGAAYADLDNDGDLDLVINHLNAPAEIYRNMLVENGNGGNWVQFSLKGSGNNSYAIGAVVNIYTPKGLIKLENYPVHGYQSSMHVPLHTGLPSPQIDSVVIRWPDGKIETVINVKVNTINKSVIKMHRKIWLMKIISNLFFLYPRLHCHTSMSHPKSNDFKTQPLMPSMISYNGTTNCKSGY